MKYKIGDIVIITSLSGDYRYCILSVMERHYRYEVVPENGGVIFLVLEDLIKCKVPSGFSPMLHLGRFKLKEL